MSQPAELRQYLEQFLGESKVSPACLLSGTPQKSFWRTKYICLTPHAYRQDFDWVSGGLSRIGCWPVGGMYVRKSQTTPKKLASTPFPPSERVPFFTGVAGALTPPSICKSISGDRWLQRKERLVVDKSYLVFVNDAPPPQERVVKGILATVMHAKPLVHPPSPGLRGC